MLGEADITNNPSSKMSQDRNNLCGDCITMSPDSKLAIVGYSNISGNLWDGEIRLIDVHSNKTRATLRTYGGNCAVESLNIGQNAYFFAAGGRCCWCCRCLFVCSFLFYFVLFSFCSVHM